MVVVVDGAVADDADTVESAVEPALALRTSLLPMTLRDGDAVVATVFIQVLNWKYKFSITR